VIDEESESILSAAGRLRRQEILRLALATAARRRARRRSFPLVAIGIMAGMILARFHHAPPIHTVAITSPKPAPSDSIVIERIETDPHIVERLAVVARPPIWQTIGDDELLSNLAHEGHPAALAYVNGQPILLVLDRH
jgi:hypothetical protein